jgi:hypothetical protein
MSVPVPIPALPEAVDGFGRVAFLVTVSDDSRPHVVAVAPAWQGESLVVAGGRRTKANIELRPEVTLLWPPVEPGGHSLLVDGVATAAGDDVALRPVSAVLHRSPE